MIWLGRALTVPAGIVFLILLLLTLAVPQVNRTFAAPSYYDSKLQEAGIHDFISGDLLLSFVDEARGVDMGLVSRELGGNPLALSGLPNEEIVASINRVFPPEWVQGVTDQIVEQFVRYVTGHSDEFVLAPNAGARVPTMMVEIRRLLRDADAYNLFHDRLVAPRVRRFIAEEELPWGIEVDEERAIIAVRRVAPPEWLQDRVEAALDDIAPYLSGEEDSFTITVQLADREVIALDEAKKLLRDVNVYDQLFDGAVIPAVKAAVDSEEDVGLGMEKADIVGIASETMTPAWLQTQIEDAIDEIFPYIVGRRDSFEIHVELTDRAEVVLDEINSLMKQADRYDLPYTKVVEPRLLRVVGESIELPFGASITGDELLSVMRDVTPLSWYFKHVDSLMADATPYLTGQADSFASRASLAANKEASRGHLENLAASRLSQIIGQLEQCGSVEEASAALLDRSSTELPRCTWPGIGADAVRRQLGMDMEETISRLVLSRIPDHAVIDDRQLRQALAGSGTDDTLDLVIVERLVADATGAVPGLFQDQPPGDAESNGQGSSQSLSSAARNLYVLDNVRRLIDHGWSYSEDDLRRDLRVGNPEAADSLEDLRKTLGEGWNFTEKDLHRLIREQAGRQDPTGDELDDPVRRLDNIRSVLSTDWTYTHEDFRTDVEDRGYPGAIYDLDSVRYTLRFSRTLGQVIWIPSLMVLFSIGFLGARSWRGRAAYAMSTLMVTSFLVFLVLGPYYTGLIKEGGLYGAAGVPNFAELKQDILDSISPQAQDGIVRDGDTGGFPETSRMAAAKVLDIAESAVDDFAAGMARSSLAVAIMGLAGLILSVLYPRIAATTTLLRKKISRGESNEDLQD